MLLAHLGLVPSLERPGRPASKKLDQRLCAHLGQRPQDAANLSSWLPAHSAAVEQRLNALVWQSWGSDNQIIASVQMLINECAVSLGRTQPTWEDRYEHCTTAEELHHEKQGALGCLCRRPRASSDTEGRVLIICTLSECGGPARLLQRQFGDKLQEISFRKQASGEKVQCEVVIGSNHIDTWRGEVELATRGVVLLQTQSVLNDPVRLLQLFEAVRQRRPLVCVNVAGGGYDFAKAKPFLLSLSEKLPQGEVATLQETLRIELVANGSGVGKLARSLSDAVPQAISVVFNPAAGDVMMEAAIKDILDKLGRGAQLLKSGSIISRWTDPKDGQTPSTPSIIFQDLASPIDLPTRRKRRWTYHCTRHVDRELSAV